MEIFYQQPEMILQDEDGATVTYLIRKANVSHSRISNYIKNTGISRTLRTSRQSQGSNKYKISQPWKRVLCKHIIHSRIFADNFGLNI